MARSLFGTARLFALTLGVLGCVTSDPIGSGGAGASGDGGAPPDDDGEVGGMISDGGSGATTASGVTCGDEVCAIGETCESCPEDCPCEGPVCGDDACDPSETCEACPDDCGECAVCGDDRCDPSEDCDTCFEDCGICACVPDPLEPNNGSGAASPSQLGVDYCELSICSGDVDWFAFDIQSGFTATIEFNHAEGDLELEIYSEATADYVSGSYSADDDESVTLTGLAAGTYWARVYGDIGRMAVNPDYCFRVD